jgi:hypothetical protein
MHFSSKTTPKGIVRNIYKLKYELDKLKSYTPLEEYMKTEKHKKMYGLS